MNITIFGTGYVGLVSGVCFAEMGNSVMCVDVDSDKICALQQGVSPIYEPGLESMLQSNRHAGRIDFTLDAQNAIAHADVIFIAVGTPPGEDGSADLSYVLEVAKTIARFMNGYKVIVNKSTVPVTTVDQVQDVINRGLQAREVSVSCDVVSNPEFLKEGAAITDCMKPDRIIIGSSSERAIAIMKQLYAPFNRNHDKVMVMDTRSAEMTKYVANAMLATKISFINEMAQVAGYLGADIEQVRLGIGADQRIGYDFIYPGCGFGGSCFPKDILALINMSVDKGYHPQLTHAVSQVNIGQKQVLFQQIHDYFSGDLQGKVIAIWGVAFKPKTDDIREAPARVLIDMLWKKGASVRIYDPEALDNFQAVYGDRVDCVYCNSMNDALTGADALAICTEWLCFRSPDFQLIKDQLKQPVVFDGRNLYEPHTLHQLGMDYYSIGRPVLSQDPAPTVT